MKRLYKSRQNKVIDGVCGGIAEYFDVDPVIIRIVFVLFFLIGGSGILAYIIAMIIIPAQPLKAANVAGQQQQTLIKNKKPPSRSESANKGSFIVGVVLILLGSFFFMRNFHFLNRYYWWIRDNFFEFFVPGIFIVFGLALIVKGLDKKKKETEKQN